MQEQLTHITHCECNITTKQSVSVGWTMESNSDSESGVETQEPVPLKKKQTRFKVTARVKEREPSRFKVRKYASRVPSIGQKRRDTWVNSSVSAEGANGTSISLENTMLSISSESNDSLLDLNSFNANQPEEWQQLYSHSVWTYQQLKHCIETLLGNQLETVRRMKAILEASDEGTWATLPESCYSAAVLFAAMNNNSRMLTSFLQRGADPEAADCENRTALHYAANSAAVDCIAILLQQRVSLEVWDNHNSATPLICAASSGRVKAVAALIQAGADVNAGIADSKRPNESSAILWATRARSPSCIQFLIEAGAAVNNPQVYSEAPIHVAAEQGDEECMRLLLQNHADVRVLLGSNRMSPLHLAAEDGSAGCVRLLLEARADCNSVNAKRQTPLHLAVLSHSTEVVGILLEAGARPDICDHDQRSPLHSATIKISRSNEIIRKLIEFGADVNARDLFDYTPLHLAAINENAKAANLLINSGADMSAKTRGGVSALNFLVRKTPDVIATIPQRLDSAIVCYEYDQLAADCELQLDFRILVPDPKRQKGGETALLTSLISAGQRHMLQHPVIRAFLHLKWHKVRSLFLVSLVFYAIFVFLLSANILMIYVIIPNVSARNETGNNSSNSLQDAYSASQANAAIPYVQGFTLFFAVLLAVKEMFQCVQTPLEYVSNLENYAHFILVVGAAVINIDIPPNNQDNTWRHHAAALLIVVAWTELLMHVGRFPVFGLYVQMFQTVAANIAKFLLAYSSLIIGFSLGLAVLFPNTEALSQLPHSLLTTMVMMTGELEYGKYFYEGDVMYPGTTHLIFFTFLLFIVIVLMNLLVGLAVSDIQGLRKSAGLDRLVRQACLIDRTEKIVFSPWLNQLSCWSLQGFLHGTILLVPLSYHRVYTIRPSDPRDDRFPSDVKEGILKIFMASKPHKRNLYATSSKPENRLEDLGKIVHDCASKMNSMDASVQQHLSDIDDRLAATEKKIDRLIEHFFNICLNPKPEAKQEQIIQAKT